MRQFKSEGTTVDINRDMDYSTRYDDKDLFTERTLEQQLDWLDEKISNEIMLCSDSIMKMERLYSRYLSDAKAAAEEGSTGYEIHYLEALRRLDILLVSAYNQFPQVV